MFELSDGPEYVAEPPRCESCFGVTLLHVGAGQCWCEDCGCVTVPTVLVGRPLFTSDDAALAAARAFVSDGHALG